MTTRAWFGLIFFAIMLMSFIPGTEGWRIVTPGNGKCSVLMPGVPNETKKISKRSDGEITIHMFMYGHNDNKDDDSIMYAISYSDISDSIVNPESAAEVTRFLDNTVNGAVDNVEGTLLTQSMIRIKNYPGREASIEIQNGTGIIKARFYMVKDRCYMLQAITFKENAHNKSINKFLDSFKLL